MRKKHIEIFRLGWSDAGNTLALRSFHEASTLTNGTILITGGCGYEYCATTEFYHPLRKEWTLGTDMNDCRWYHTSTLLYNGKVLVAGGYIEEGKQGKAVKYSLNGAELFDPTTGGWNSTGSLHQQRHSHAASVLPKGKILVAGGADHDFLNSAELYDPSTKNWSITGSMHFERVWHTATTLDNGKILVIGGMNDESEGDAALETAEIYNPSIEKWENVSSMHYPRYGHTATLLTNGKVLVVGGVDLTFSSSNSAELFDPTTETWTVTGSMMNARAKHTASLLRNGKVLVAGGGTGGDVIPGFNTLNTAKIYDPSTGMWTNTSSMSYTRSWHTASVLENGNVLVVGGISESESADDTSELYNSSTNAYIPLSDLKNK